MLSFIVLALVLITVMLAVFCIQLARNTFGSGVYLFSPPVFCIAYFAIRSFPAVVDMVAQLESVRPLLAVTWALAGICGSLIFIQLMPHRTATSTVLIYQPNPKLAWIAIVISIGCVALTFAMLGRVPFLYLIQDLSGGGAELSMHEARRLNTLQHRAGDTVYFGQGYFRLIYQDLAPIFVSLLYVERRLTHQSTFFVRVLMVAFCFFAALNGQIWPFVNTALLFLVLIISFPIVFAVRGEDAVRVGGVIIKAFIAMVVLIAFVFLYRYGQYLSGREFDNFWLDTFRRIYSAETSKLFVLFPEVHEYRLGSTWINDLLGFLPGSVQSFSYEVHYLIHGGAWGFTAAPGLMASAYVNFGMAGVVLLFFSVFLIYGVVYKKLASSSKTEDRVLAITMSLLLAIALSADITSVIMPAIIFVACKVSLVVGGAALGLARRGVPLILST